MVKGINEKAGVLMGFLVFVAIGFFIWPDISQGQDFIIGNIKLTIDVNREYIAGRVYTPNCAADCHLPVNISVNKTYTINDLSKFRNQFKDRFGNINNDNVISYGFDLLQTQTEITTIANCTRISFTTPNATETTIERCLPYNTSADVFVWKPFNPLGKTLQANKVYTVDFWFNKKVQLGIENNIDNQIFIADQDVNLAWGNGTYQRRMNVTFYDMRGGVSVGTIMPVHVNFTGLSPALSFNYEARILNQTGISIPYNLSSNTSTSLAVRFNLTWTGNGSTVSLYWNPSVAVESYTESFSNTNYTQNWQTHHENNGNVSSYEGTRNFANYPTPACSSYTMEYHNANGEYFEINQSFTNARPANARQIAYDFILIDSGGDGGEEIINFDNKLNRTISKPSGYGNWFARLGGDYELSCKYSCGSGDAIYNCTFYAPISTPNSANLRFIQTSSQNAFYGVANGGGTVPTNLLVTEKFGASPYQQWILNESFGILESETAENNAAIWYSANVTAPTNYNPLTYTLRNITIENSNGTVFLESNISGSFVNYTMSNNSITNFYRADIVGVGAFTSRIIMFSSLGSIANTTGYVLNYTIGKSSGAAVSIGFNMTSPQTYGKPISVQANITTGDSSATITIYQNGTQVKQGSGNQSYNLILGAGLYNFSAYYSESQNYTNATTINNNYQITKAGITTTIYINGTAGSVLRTYPNATNTTCFKSATINDEGVLSCIRNDPNTGLNVSVGSSVNANTAAEHIKLGACPTSTCGFGLGTRTYNYTINITGLANYTYSVTPINLQIQRGTGTRRILLNGTDITGTTITRYYPNATNVTFSAITSEGIDYAMEMPYYWSSSDRGIAANTPVYGSVPFGYYNQTLKLEWGKYDYVKNAGGADVTHNWTYNDVLTSLATLFINQTYNISYISNQSVAYETNSSIFRIQFGVENRTRANVTGNLTYNGVVYQPNQTTIGYNNYTFLFNVTVPLVQTNGTNNTFTYNFTVNYIERGYSESFYTNGTQMVLFSSWVTAIQSNKNVYAENEFGLFDTYIRTLFKYANNTVNTTLNATNYSSSLFVYNTTHEAYRSAIRMPLLDVDNRTFNWTTTANISFNDNFRMVYNQLYNLTVTKLSLGLCGSGLLNTTVLTFRDYDERYTNNNLNANMTITLNYTVDGSLFRVFNTTYINQAAMPICMYPNTGQYYATSFQQYSANGYPARFYFLLNASLNNASNNISLYSLESAIAKTLTITLQRKDLTNVADAYVTLQRYYPENDSYVAVSMGITDSNGKASPFQIETDSAYYRIIFTKDNQVLLITTRQIFSQASTTACGTYACEKYELPSASSIPWLSYYGRVAAGCNNNTATNLTCTWIDTSGLSATYHLVVRNTTLTSAGKICDLTDTSSSGTLICNLGNTTNQLFSYMFTTVTSNGVDTLAAGYLDFRLTTIIGSFGLFLTLMMVVTFAGMGAWNPSVAIFLALTALVVSIPLGINNIAIGGIVSIVLVGILLIRKINKPTEIG